MGWQVIKVKDANDVAALNRAIKKAKAEKEAEAESSGKDGGNSENN